MVHTLLIIILVLVILLVCITILFHRQGMRLNEEIRHAIESEDVKSNYLANVSQNFREPLHAIIANCEAIERQPCFKEHPNVVQAIEDIRYQSQQLFQYTDEILEISNTEGNIPHSAKIEVNLIELMMSYRREILHDVKSDVQVKLRTDLSPHTKVWLDTTMFRQLIMHLLRSAAQNTDEGYISIRYQEENEGLRFWVENTHTPPSQEVLDTMFTDQIDPANNEIATTDKDVVLSMSICKAIIDNLKGRIEASGKDTEVDGRITVITFWFPCTLTVY